jgi:NADH:ubiquinone oxidoreductase subunit
MFRALLLQKLEAGSPISKAEVFYQLGVVHHRLDEKPKAVQMLERAIQTDPNLTAAQTLLNEIKN